MGTFFQNMGSLIREESSFSNEPDPWDNDTPLLFQSVRRESRAKPPPAARFPRSITTPAVLSQRPLDRNRNNTDFDEELCPPKSPRFAPNSRRSLRFSRQQVINEHHHTEDASPVSMSSRSKRFSRQKVVNEHHPAEDVAPAPLKRSAIREGNKSVSSPSESKSMNWKSRSDRQGGNIPKSKTQGLLDKDDVKLNTNVKAEVMPPVSPISEDAGNEEEGPSHRAKSNWLRIKVHRVLRIGRKERA